MIKRGSPQSRTPSVDRALEILELVARCNSGLTATELSRRLSVPYSSTHDILFTLVARGYIQRIPGTLRYSLGMQAFPFAPLNAAELQLRRTFSNQLDGLGVRSGLYVTAGVRKAVEGLIIFRIDPPAIRGGELWTGHHFDLHCCALGKALTAWLPDQELNAMFGSRKLLRYTPKTICDFKALEANLADARDKGFALGDEELNPGCRGIGAPVFGRNGLVVASVAVAGSITDIPTSRIKELASDLLSTTKRISEQMALDHRPVDSPQHTRHQTTQRGYSLSG
jgi:DNA-binding IclR family transcriptional regulator